MSTAGSCAAVRSCSLPALLLATLPALAHLRLPRPRHQPVNVQLSLQHRRIGLQGLFAVLNGAVVDRAACAAARGSERPAGRAGAVSQARRAGMCALLQAPAAFPLS